MLKKVKHYVIGKLPEKEYQETEISKDWRALLFKIKSDGLFDTNYSFYYREALKFGITWFSMVYLAVCGQSTTAYIASSLCAAFLWHQAAFVAHDGSLYLFI